MNVHKNARLTLRRRERIVRQVDSGQTPEAVAEAAGVCPRTVRKWVGRYRREGLAGLQDRSSRSGDRDTPLTSENRKVMSEPGYDVIGDIHGHADALRRLLNKLGYVQMNGVFRHTVRRAIFVGDFVDRGPEQREVIAIARAMCVNGAACAVLGNHEFNAIAWATPDDTGGFLRPHSEKNLKQHEEFLRQLDEGSPEYFEALQWFRVLPVWLDCMDFRVIHACWHHPSIAVLKSCLNNRNCFSEEGFCRAAQRGSDAYCAAEILIKGPEERLPSGIFFLDKDGHKREEVRIKWWEKAATTFRKAAIGMDDRLEELPNTELPIDYRYLECIPVLFGHYWMNGKPVLTASNAACLDFSVAKNGYLTAYRWSGEQQLLPVHLVNVFSTSSEWTRLPSRRD